MEEKETNVAIPATVQEPAKTAEIEPAAELPAASPGAPIEAAEETTVSLEYFEQTIAAFREEIARLRAYVDATKAEIIGTPRPAGPILVEPAAEPATVQGGELVVGAPVKLWTDAKHKNFHLGTIVAIHGEGDAFDVRLDELGGGTTKVWADSLEFDDRR
jgi:uncharacterized small protein (DUF1192 family)